MSSGGIVGIIGADRWGQIQRTKKTQPYLRLLCVMDNNTPDECRALHGIIRLADDPFWGRDFPTDGRIMVQQLAAFDLERSGLALTKDEDLPSFVINQLDK